jgi:DNA gyrase subunit A
MTTREEDAVKYFLACSSHDSILFFTNTGRVFQTRAYEIPGGSRVARGQAVVNVLQLGSSERVTAMLPVQAKKEKEGYLVMATQSGIIKKTPLADFENVRRSGLIAVKLDKDDQLGWADLSSGKDEIILVSRNGQAIRFKEKDVRPMGRGAAGVRGIRLKKGDLVIGMQIIRDQNLKLLVVTENGFGKATALKQFKIQKRGGSGLKAAKVTSKTGAIVTARILRAEDEDLIVISTKGQVIRISLKDVPLLGRATQGVRIMKLEAKDRVASITCV